MRNLHDEDSSAHFSQEDLSFLISQIVDNEMHNSMVDRKNIKGRKREFLHSHSSDVEILHFPFDALSTSKKASRKLIKFMIACEF